MGSFALNLKVRARNKAFWTTFLPALGVLVQVCAVPFGYTIDLTEFVGQAIAIVNAVFVVLAILGLVTDPTTPGFWDSERALGYKTPGEE